MTQRSLRKEQTNRKTTEYTSEMERKTPKLCYGATAVTEIKSVEKSSQPNTAQAYSLMVISGMD